MKRVSTVLAFASAVWAFCGAIVFIGRVFLSLETTLIVHAVGAPLGAAFFSWIYFARFGYTSPLVTAAIFVATALTLDFFVVSMLIEKNFDMFMSALGVWLPQALIFAATYLTGLVVGAQRDGISERQSK